VAFKSRTAERHTRFDAPSAAHFQDNPTAAFSVLVKVCWLMLGFSFHLRFYMTLFHPVPRCWQELNGQYLEQPDQSIQGKAGVSREN